MYVLISYFSVAQWAFWYTTSCTSGRHSSVKAAVPRTTGRFCFWVGAILAHLSPPALSRRRSIGLYGLRVQCHPGSLPRRSQHSRTVPTKIIDAIGSPDLLCCRGCHGFASMYGGACSAKGKAPTRCEGTIHPRGDLRQTLELHAVSGPSIIQGNVLGV